VYRRARRLYSQRMGQGRETAASAAVAADSAAHNVASGSRTGAVNVEDVSRAAEAGARDDGTASTASAAAAQREDKEEEEEELSFNVVSDEEFRKRVEKRKLTISAYDQLKLRVDSTTTCVDEGICLSAYEAQVGFPCQVPKLPRHPKWAQHERRLAGDFTPPPPQPPWRGPVQVRIPNYHTRMSQCIGLH